MFCLVYIDDIVIYSKTFDEHLIHLERILQRFFDAHFTFNLPKCRLFLKEFDHLGHLLSAQGIKPNPDKIAALQEMSAPTDLKQLQSFLGLANWFRRFVPSFAKLSAPLTDLLKHSTTWLWTEACQTAFEALKTVLASAPVMGFPDPSKPYVLVVDASNRQIGASSMQSVDDLLRPIYYLSRTLDVHEVKYSVSEKECLALAWAIKSL
jgi:hypothetical protein